MLCTKPCASLLLEPFDQVTYIRPLHPQGLSFHLSTLFEQKLFKHQISDIVRKINQCWARCTYLSKYSSYQGFGLLIACKYPPQEVEVQQSFVLNCKKYPEQKTRSKSKNKSTSQRSSTSNACISNSILVGAEQWGSVKAGFHRHFLWFMKRGTKTKSFGWMHLSLETRPLLEPLRFT